MSRSNRITSRQVTAALELLGMTQAELASAAKISVVTMTNFVQGHHKTRETTVEAIRFALEQRGIEFTNGGEPGVKLRPSKAVVQP